jgi:hypothetical protein
VIKLTDRLLNRIERRPEREVEEELRFHVEMQAQAYEEQGLTPEESATRAAVRFGDFAQIKKECMAIGSPATIRTWAMKSVFTMAFLVGIAIRILSNEYHFTRVGDLLIMIAIFGGLLVYAKRTGPNLFRPERESFKLGLNQTEAMPLAFDEKGRTPFDRVRTD